MGACCGTVCCSLPGSVMTWSDRLSHIATCRGRLETTSPTFQTSFISSLDCNTMGLEMFSNLYFTPRELGEAGQQFVAHYWSGPINWPHPRWQSLLCGNFITTWSGTTWVTTSIISALEWAYPHTFTSYTHPESSRRHNAKLSSTSQFVFSSPPAGGATLAGWGYQWCLQWEFPYLLTSPRPHTPTWSRLLWTPYPGRAKWTSTDHHQTSGGERTTPTTEILYTDVTTQGPPASTVSAQLATVSSQQCATCPSPIAKHLTGPSSGTFSPRDESNVFMRLLPLRNITGVVRSTDFILADNQSCVAISLRPGQVRLGWPLPASPPLWNEPIPTLSPHTHILNQVVDITLSWAPHHSFVFSSSRWQQLAEVTNDVAVRIPLSSD